MKRPTIITITLLALFMSSCLVSSLHPFYLMKDKIFEESLLGQWMDGDSSIWVITRHMTTDNPFGEDRPDTSYAITYYEEKDKPTRLQGVLFSVDGEKYVDFSPEPNAEQFQSDMLSFHYVPVHTLARMRFKGDTLMLLWYGQDWLNDLFENNRIRIAHETVYVNAVDKRHVLTADTRDLQKFIAKYMNGDQVKAEIEEAFRTGKEPNNHVFLKLIPYDGPTPE